MPFTRHCHFIIEEVGSVQWVHVVIGLLYSQQTSGGRDAHAEKAFMSVGVAATIELSR